MASKLDTNKPYGKVLGFVEGVVGARFSQDGKLFNAQHDQVYPVTEPKREVPESVTVAAPKKAKKETQLPPGLPTKE